MIENGVLQGFIWGLLLFLLYIDNIVSNFPEDALSLFVDDTSLFIRETSRNSLISKAQNVVESISDGFPANNVSITWNSRYCFKIK